MSTRKPTLLAYTVKERGNGQKPIWTRIGACWPHSEGNGLSIQIEALPLDGKLVLIEPRPEASDPQASDRFGSEGGAA